MASIPVDKVIVTNVEKLKHKYGAQWKKIQTAIGVLIKADKKRGLNTLLVDLSSASDMKACKGKPVPATSAGDPRANKDAVDAVFETHWPAYLMLLGAIDVIPHQDLKNPVYDPGGDDDKTAWSDLPYACDAAYSPNARNFLVPTRVVGRLPDVNAGSDPSYVVDLLKTAASYRQRPVADYGPYLGISAEVWKDSTDLSLRAVFGNASSMKVAPPDGPNWTPAEWGALSHFINCHGAPADWKFYGQHGNSYPVAHDAKLVPSHLPEGTVLAAECCYGAELYDPAPVGGQIGMCNTYLASGAYAYFGSSTIAYGPSDTNDWADLICQYFLQHLRSGSSAGRACLEARVQYIKRAHTLSPTDLKTLAQFSLMGDPAVTPVVSPVTPAHVMAVGKRAKAPQAARSSMGQAGRFLRRETLRAAAKAARQTVYVASLRKGEDSPRAKALGVEAKLRAAARELGIEDGVMMSFPVDGPALPKSAMKYARAIALPAPTTIHVLAKRLDVPAETAKLKLVRGLEATEFDGSLELRHFVSR